MDVAVEVDRMLGSIYPSAEPGVVAVVVKDDEVVFRGAYGMASIELGVPMTPEMVFHLGSLTKQFTAAAVLLLEQQGKLSLQDSISRYLSGYPTHGHHITLEHLLTHTSGIFDFAHIPGYMANPVKLDVTTDELIDVFKSRPMSFAPGSAYRYSSSGFILAGAIVEKVSGRSFGEFVKERIFGPLGMTSSHYGGRHIVPMRVCGYEKMENNVYRNADLPSMTQGIGAGCLLSNVDDLARWDSASRKGELLSADNYRRMTTRHRLKDGRSIEYGYGTMFNVLRRWDAFGHSGVQFGFLAVGFRVPARNTYVALLSNNPRIRPYAAFTAMRIGAIALGEPFPQWQPGHVPVSALERFTGLYRFGGRNPDVAFFIENELPFTRRQGSQVGVLAASSSRFFYEDELTYFDLLGEGRDDPPRMLLHPHGVDEPITGKRISREVAVA